MADTLDAYAKTPIGLRIGAAAATLVGVLALVHKNVQKLSERSVRVVMVLYVLVAVGLCTVLLRDLWYIAWPLSGAQRLLTGSLGGEDRACAILKEAGPVTLLNMLLACVLIMFAPVVLVPPAQRMRGVAGAGELPKWCVRCLMRLYSLIFVAQMANCWYVYAFLEAHLLEFKALHKDLARYADNAQVLDAFGAAGVEVVMESVGEDRDAFYNDLSAMAFLIPYVIVSWCTLIIVYERLTGRSFKVDFPGAIILMLCPCLKTFEHVAGRMAQYFTLGEDEILEFARKCVEAKAIVNEAPGRLAGVTVYVKMAFKEAQDCLQITVSDAKRKLDEHSVSKGVVDHVKESLHGGVDAQMEKYFAWKAGELEYFAGLRRLLTDGLEAETPPPPASEARRKRRGKKDDIALPDEDFKNTLAKGVHQLIDDACGAVSVLNTPADSLDQIEKRLSAEVVQLREKTVGALDAVRTETARFAKDLEVVCARLGDVLPDAQERVLGLGQDAMFFQENSDHFIRAVEDLHIRKSAAYPSFYKAAFLLVAAVALTVAVLVFGVLFVFRSRWTAPAQALIAYVMALLGFLVAFNASFFSEAIRGRLAQITQRGMHLDLELAEAPSQAKSPPRKRGLGDDAGDSERTMGSEEVATAQETVGLLAAEGAQEVTDCEGGGAVASMHQQLVDRQETEHFYFNVVKAPLVCMLFIVLGAYLVSSASGISPEVCPLTPVIPRRHR